MAAVPVHPAGPHRLTPEVRDGTAVWVCAGNNRVICEIGTFPGPGNRGATRLDGVAGGFGGVLPAGWGGPPEGTVRELIHFPSGVLLEPVVPPTLGPAVAQAGPAACLIRDVMFEITVTSRPAAGRVGAGGVPYLGQVPQPDPGVVALTLEPVVAILGGDGVEGDQQVWPGSPGPQLPCPVPAGRAVLV